MISGIGPALAKMLQSKGIANFVTLAAMDEKQLRAVLDEEGTRYRRFDPSSWPAQAKALQDTGKLDI
ncbi:MAG: hypothetical protein KZQ78_12915 [Candidatus Thiodiazotropha sp. (ex Ustalcina ferruginea)]|nr:hypothetical protein [Candidatus Thiodiazotropha sp. (ex Ustalcina ferruginea)]